MRDYGEKCKYCKCARCANWSKCGLQAGNVEEYCDMDCCGELGYLSECKSFEKGEGSEICYAKM